jgi:hypothetical protein
VLAFDAPGDGVDRARGVKRGTRELSQLYMVFQQVWQLA